MNFLDFAAKRYSVRDFAPTPIEDDKIQMILEAARLAPTACNYQPQKIYVLKSEKALAAARSVTRFLFNAPMAFMICVDDTQVWHSPMEPGYSTADMDGSIVCTHMMLEAWDLGIGSVWVRGFDSRELAKAFDLPEHIKPVCLLPVGYPSETSKPAGMHKASKKIIDFVEDI